MLLRFSVFAIVLFCFASICYAKACYKYDHLGRKITYACKEPEERMRVQWDTETTRRGAEVVSKKIKNVCNNYRMGSIEYRNCLDDAQKIFSDKCHNLRFGNGNKIDMDMYCDAERMVKYSR